METKKISVIIPCYNRTEFINDAIKSVINNLNLIVKPEILIVSNLEKKMLINKEYINNIEYIYNKGETYGNMMKEAIKYANTDLIAFLEDDDVFSDNKIKEILNEFKKNDKLSYYHNLSYNIDRYGKNMDNKQILKSKLEYKPFKSFKDLKRIMRKEPDHNLSSMVIRKEFINKNDFINMEKINLSIDTYIYTIMLKDENILIEDNKYLTGYRIHNNNTTNIENNIIIW